jgi:hypothetical protein
MRACGLAPDLHTDLFRGFLIAGQAAAGSSLAASASGFALVRVQ